MKILTVIAVAMAALGMVLASTAACDTGRPAPSATPRPIHSGVQPATIPIECQVPGVPLATECAEGGAPRCAEEDGNLTGEPCLWRDPSSGTLWYVDGSEYRR